MGTVVKTAKPAKSIPGKVPAQKTAKPAAKKLTKPAAPVKKAAPKKPPALIVSSADAREWLNVNPQADADGPVPVNYRGRLSARAQAAYVAATGNKVAAPGQAATVPA